MGILVIKFIQEANFKVEIVSSKWVDSGHMLAIIIDWQLPPIESFKKYVNLDYLYGRQSLVFSLKATTNYSK